MNACDPRGETKPCDFFRRGCRRMAVAALDCRPFRIAIPRRHWPAPPRFSRAVLLHKA